MVRFSAVPQYKAWMEEIEFGVSPQILVNLTPEDTEKGIDTIIEAAIEYIKEN